MDWTALNWVDWLFLIVLTYGAVLGLIRGLSHELAMLISVVVAGLVTWLGYGPLADWAVDQWKLNIELARLLSIIFLLFASWVGMHLLRIALGAIMSFSFKGMPERLGGLLVGMLRHGALYLVLMLITSFIPFAPLQRAVMYHSSIGRAVLPHLVHGYNTMAQKAAILQAEVPMGVDIPHAVMPPVVEEEPAASSSADYPLPPVWEP
ncbi:MAG: CvpA family protein [Verrucomicrobiota bacterium]|jgi:uncharacterized membrane protein required for colicin V production|nr:CvpA family protein [Verrucomicrobiota bacterium]